MLKTSTYSSQLNYSQPGVCQQTLKINGSSVQALAMAQDERMIIGSTNEQIEIWDTSKFDFQGELAGHTNSITTLALTSNNTLISGSWDKTIKLWNMNNGDCQKTLVGHKGFINIVTLCSDDELGSGSWDNTVNLWDMHNGKCKQTFNQHSSSVHALAQCTDGRLVSGSEDNTIKFWDMRSGGCEQSIYEHRSRVSTLSVYSDNHLASGSWDKSIILWDLRNTKKPKQTLQGHSEYVYALAPCSNEQIASASADSSIKIWDLGNFMCTQTLTGHNAGVTALILTHDGKLVSGSKDDTIKVWDFPKLTQLQKPIHTQAAEVTHTTRKPQPVNVQSIATSTTASASSSELNIDELKQKAESYYEEGNYAEAVKLYRKLSLKGDANANKMVANLEEIINKASKPLAKDKKSSHSDAADSFKKGNRYLEKKDFEKAKSYFKRADKSHYPGAQAKLKEVEEFLAKMTIAPQVPASAPQPVHAPLPVAKAAASEPGIPEKVALAPKLAMEVSYAHLTFEKELGKGGFGVVHRGQWQRTTVAIKQLITTSLTPQALSEFTYEAQLMSQLRHPNIVTFYKICTEPGRYCIVMEYCEKGSLYGWLRTPESNSWQERMRISVELAKGLMFLHEHKILHRDLKGLNVLLDKTLTAKITDFGLSKVKTETTSQATGGMKGTLRWNPPELISGEVEHHSEKTDIYSLGMTFWEIASRKIPFESQGNEMIVANWIAQGKKETVPADTPAPLAQLIGQCWDKRSAQRPTAQAAVDMLDGARAGLTSAAQAQDYRLTSEAPTQQSKTNNYRLTS